MDEKYKRSLRTEAKRGNLFLQNLLLSAQQVTKREPGRGSGKRRSRECKEAFISKLVLDEAEIKGNLKGNWS